MRENKSITQKMKDKCLEESSVIGVRSRVISVHLSLTVQPVVSRSRRDRICVVCRSSLSTTDPEVLLLDVLLSKGHRVLARTYQLSKYRVSNPWPSVTPFPTDHKRIREKNLKTDDLQIFIFEKKKIVQTGSTFLSTSSQLESASE